MWKLAWTEAFSRRYRKLLRRNPQLDTALSTVLARLAEDPHHPSLRMHQLAGGLEGVWAVRVTYSVRLLLVLNEPERELTLLALGSHDEVYR